MIYGIGTDIIETGRVKIRLIRNKGLREELFTQKEIEYCELKRHQFQHYAARYAGKEAFFKALGTGWRFGFKFIDIEILNNKLGKPEIFTSGKVAQYLKEKNIKNIHISISHLKKIVNAFVIIEI